MEKPLISVIIPAYNHEKFVEETIRSVLCQTWPNLELLVVDDGSRDHTWDVLQRLKPECEKRLARVCFEHQENRGTCETMNRLLAESRGKYLFDIASDDVIADKETIELEADFLESNPDYVLAVGNDDMIDERSQRIAWDRHRNILPFDDGEASADMASQAVYKGRSPFEPEIFGSYESILWNNYMPNGYLIRRSALPEGPFFTKKAPMEDWHLMLHLAKKGKMKYIDRILYHYRWHSGNTSRRIYHMQDMKYRTWLYERELARQEGRTDLLAFFEQKPCLHPLDYTIRCRLHPLAEAVRKLLGLPSHE